MQRSKKIKKNKKAQLEEDPILKKKVKKNPQIAITSGYEKFLRKYKINKGALSERNYASNVKKMPLNEIQLLKLPRIKFLQKSNYQGYSRHFEEDYKKFTNKIIEEGTKPNESQTTSELLKNFSFNAIEDNSPNLMNKTENDILNNNIKIKNYVMKKEFKRNKNEYCSNHFEKIIADKNAQSFLESEGIALSPMIHKKIAHLPKQEEFDQEDDEVFSFLNEYLDFIYIGNEENEFLKVKKC